MAIERLLAATLILAIASQAQAGGILDAVKRHGVLRCAAVERPGYAAIEGDAPAGVAAGLCRTVAEAALGRGGRFALRLIEDDDDMERVRNGDVDLAFLEPRTVTEGRLDAALTPVTEAYRDRFVVMVPRNSPAQGLGDLGAQTICFMIGEPVWPLLQDGLRRRGASFRPFGFSEEVEMKDAYNIGRCGAMAGLASTLDELRADGGVNHLVSRIIDEPLGPDPVIAMVPVGDGEWAATVRQALQGSPAPR